MSIEDFRADAMRCSRCAYCKWMPLDLMKSWRFSKGCPSVEYGNFHSYSAGGRLITALSLMDGRSTVTDKVRDSVFMCNMCGSCDVACKICRYDMEPLQAMRELRAKLVEEGHLPPALAKCVESLKTDHNMLGAPKERRGDWAKTLGIKDLTRESAKIVFHAGCRYSFDGEQSAVARTAVGLLKKAGVDFGIMGASESCCGGRSYGMGVNEPIKHCAESNLAKWRAAGVETVVTPCADCYYAFKRLYPQLAGSQIKVVHMVELVDQLVRDGRLKMTKPVAMKVTYHDPCHLGRQGEDYVPWSGKEKKIFGQAVCYDPPRPRYNGAFGVYEAPRNLLQSIPGIELVEMERNREAAWCCGAGGGAREAYPKFSQWTAGERIEEAEATGADALVSACPWCEKNFSDSVRHGGRKLKVFDILQLVEQAL
jgi:Fe-S oxidoreductase